jgi:hypothetical protein
MIDYLRKRHAELVSRYGYAAIAVGTVLIGCGLIWPEYPTAESTLRIGEPLLAAGLMAWLLPGGPKV